ncbi:MAG: DMT family transporter [Alphaproteobacteria bacterium]|nr:DMT family transporter [Alphaproteobacteria bacterium]
MTSPATAATTAAGPSLAGSTLPAIAMMVLALSVLPVSDSIGKYLTASVPVLQVVWARYFFHLAVVTPIALAGHGRRALAPRVAARQAIRGVFLVMSSISFFFGLRFLPLADSVAVLFVAPLIVTALAPLVLGERVGWRRYAAVAVGFLGALAIIRPGGGAYGWYALFPLASGFCYAGYLLATRKLAGSAPPMVTLAYTAVTGAAVLSAILPFVWRWPTPLEMVLMASMGPIAASGHYLLIRAHERAPASLLAPFSYWQIVTTAAIGYVLFGDFPDRWTWTGAAILVASGLYVWLRERKLAPRHG